MGKESDPFLNELQAYDDIRKCYDILEKIEGGNQKLYLVTIEIHIFIYTTYLFRSLFYSARLHSLNLTLILDDIIF